MNSSFLKQRITQRIAQRMARTEAPRGGFTLIQIVIVMAIIALLATFLLSAFGQNKATAHRAQCDMKLKAITMALDAFRQENGHYPEQLSELLDKKYLTDAAMLKCPSDPRPNGTYDDSYIMRSGRGGNELPILVCSLCAGESGQAEQAFQGRYTKQFATRPAQLTQASVTTIKRPGKTPIAGRSGMQLRGGDIIITGAGGQAIVRFADGSESEMSGDSQITVLQSFVDGHMRAPLYTLINQKFGDVSYRVHHGSKFDVTTPTATAGALGTEFRIKSDSGGTWWIKVIESKVYVTNLDEQVIVTPTRLNDKDSTNNSSNNTANKAANGTENPLIVTPDWLPIGQEETTQSTTPNTTPTPTPSPTQPPSATVNPTPTPIATPTQSSSSSSSSSTKKKKKRSGHYKIPKTDHRDHDDDHDDD